MDKLTAELEDSNSRLWSTEQKVSGFVKGLQRLGEQRARQGWNIRRAWLPPYLQSFGMAHKMSRNDR